MNKVIRTCVVCNNKIKIKNIIEDDIIEDDDMDEEQKVIEEAFITIDECSVHKFCLPGIVRCTNCSNKNCTNGKGKLDINLWWPKISTYSDLVAYGHALTRETKYALLYSYWIMKKAGIPKDVIKMILPRCILPHGPITNTQNGLSFTFLLEKFETEGCDRCGYLIFPSITNYPIHECKNGPCQNCGLSTCGKTCDLHEFSRPLEFTSPYLTEIGNTLGLPQNLSTRQLKTRIRYILQTNEISPSILPNLILNLKYLI